MVKPASNGNQHMVDPAHSNGNSSNGNSKQKFVPSDDIQGRWEGVVRPYSNQEVSLPACLHLLADADRPPPALQISNVGACHSG